jgi:hypothetical protein
MPHPVFQKFVTELEAAVSSWENRPPNEEVSVEEHDLFCGLRNALDTYYAEVARR